MLRKLVRPVVDWLDAYSSQAKPVHADRVMWLRAMPFMTMHAACLLVVFVGVSSVAVWTCLALYAVRMVAITGFYHRYFSHRAFRTSRGMQFCMALLGASAAQRGPLWWAAHHRKHHKYSDTEQDSHSPVTGTFMWSHVLWFMTTRNQPTDHSAVKDLARFPELVWLDRFDKFVPLVLIGLLYVFGEFLASVAPSWGTSGAQMIIWGFAISTTLLFHGTATVNSLCHKFGRRRYQTRDESRNNVFVALITSGEGWHNNHHHYPAAARQGFFWWEIDTTYYLLRGLAAVGLIWDLKPVPARIIAGERVPVRERRKAS